jgi:PAS domain S-box-containing protein
MQPKTGPFWPLRDGETGLFRISAIRRNVVMTKQERPTPREHSTDTSVPGSRERRILDHSPLPTLVLDGSRKLTYANSEALRLLGVSNIEGLKLDDLFSGSESQAVINQQLSRRQGGVGDMYEIELTRPSDGKRFHVSILGIPLLDEQGSVTGSIGIIRSLELEKASQAIHHLIETERDIASLLRAVADIVQRITPFDLFSVSQYGPNMEHAASLFIYSPGAVTSFQKRWYALSPSLKSWILKAGATVVDDLREFLRKEEWSQLLQDPDVANFVDQGFQSFLRIPVTRENQLVAAISIVSKKAHQYSDQDLYQLHRLPLEAAVHMALYYRDLRTFEFRYELIKGISGCSTPKEIAGLLVRELSAHFGWEHVALFQVDTAPDVFRLMEQESRGEIALPAEYKQSLKEGVLGRAYQTKTDQNIDDVKEESLYISKLGPEMKSELCLPILCDNEVRWVLNVEDRMGSAFSEEEVATVRTVLDEAALVLKRVCWQHLLQSAVAEAGDAVILTDNHGEVVYANAATAELLRYQSCEEISGPFGALFADKETANGLLKASKTVSQKVNLLCKDGTRAQVTLSAGSLPEDVSGKVFIAKDLTGQVLINMKGPEWLKGLFK